MKRVIKDLVLQKKQLKKQEQFLVTIYIHSIRHLQKTIIIEALLCKMMEGKKSQFTLKNSGKIQIQRNAVLGMIVETILILSERLVLVYLIVLNKSP
uniref:Macaca fascicularis brain cDNA clone: QmoA-12063, similar to human cell cycle progression 8 protein (CPR8), mRNA, RefSeq: NM_020739.1 n=1 Tax=Macaca fascicularis TaxID=9541 RepID=I7GJ63_MACFA|nr:unnamed protein product [Macaca fascicularis]